MNLPRAKSIGLTRTLAIALFVSGGIVLSPETSGQVRLKQPDRGVYQPPVMPSEPKSVRPSAALVDVPLTDVGGQQLVISSDVQLLSRPARLKQVDHQEVSLTEAPIRSSSNQQAGQGATAHQDAVQQNSWPAPVGSGLGSVNGSYPNYANNYEIGYGDGGYITETYVEGGCDSYGCDSMACGPGHCGTGNWSNASIAFTPNRWFGSAELLLMFRSGDHPPALLTTGDAANAIPGARGQNGTRVLVGEERFLDEMTAGGRLTIGTWLDDCRMRSLVFRGWLAGKETFSFAADQGTTPIITRPFFDVTPPGPAREDTLVVATPGETTVGVANVSAASEVYGGDISVRQQAYSRFGGVVDVLYGYQFMRMDENLRISSTSTAGPDSNSPLGSVISVRDSFEIENEFHGGQIGFASRYREGCWSFRSLVKVAFGQLSRRSTLSGATTTSNGGPAFVDPNGLLVRSTNDGQRTDNTFAWVPELDLSLGWHYFPRFDVTIGYHLVAMTDAVQVSGLIDPQLASNLANPLAEPFRPASQLRDSTFYVHGIHFGLQYVY